MSSRLVLTYPPEDGRGFVTDSLSSFSMEAQWLSFRKKCHHDPSDEAGRARDSAAGTAISRAFNVSRRTLTALIAQPTTNREYKSRIAARYSKPINPTARGRAAHTRHPRSRCDA